jgi:hypothetical protein
MLEACYKYSTQRTVRTLINFIAHWHVVKTPVRCGSLLGKSRLFYNQSIKSLRVEGLDRRGMKDWIAVEME